MTEKHKFATALWQQLDKNNLVFSPISVQLAMAMLLPGADGETQKELVEALGLGYTPFARAQTLVRQVLSNREGVEISTSNGVWIMPGDGQNPEPKLVDHYRDQVLAFFAAEPVAFGPSRTLESIAHQVNAGVFEDTRGLIKELITARDLAGVRLLLTNCVYFKGTWQVQFDPKRTVDDVFNGVNGPRAVKMMYRKGEILYQAGKGHQAVMLPYAGEEIFNIIVLPTYNLDLRNWAMPVAAWQQILDGMHEQDDLQLYLPRHRVEATLDLVAPLQGVGIRKAFTDAAEFPNILQGESLKVSGVKHKAVLETNEEGSEAAAATAVMMKRCLGVVDNTVVRCDRPFVSAIYDKANDEFLFMATVTDIGDPVAAPAFKHITDARK